MKEISNFLHLIQYMKLKNNDKNKGKFQSFVYFTKVNDNDFRASLFIKRSYNIFLVNFIMFEHTKVGKHIEYMLQKLSKDVLVSKFQPRMKFLHIFFSFFHPRMKSHSCLFDRDEFILGCTLIPGKTCKQ